MASVADGSRAFMRLASRKQDEFCIVLNRAKSERRTWAARRSVRDSITDDTKPMRRRRRMRGWGWKATRWFGTGKNLKFFENFS
jgi:hypothetical protein